MEIYYLNSNNKRIDLNDKAYHMLDGTTLFDNEWEYITQGINNLKIAIFKKSLVQKNFSLKIRGDDIPDYYDNLNYLLSVFEEDIYNVKAGKLYFNDWYLECFVIGTERPEKYLVNNYSVSNFTIVSEDGMWTKTKQNLYRISNRNANQTGYDFPYDFSIDYQNSLNNSFIINESYRPTDFELIIYGKCENPEFSIADNTYSFNVILEKGEYLKVNSIDKTILKYSNGEVSNEFSSRGIDFDVFTPIPSGKSTIVWEADFDFDITILQQRNEPLWT